MPVFGAIAAAIVSALAIPTTVIVGSITVAGLATTLIATGLAVGTAKILGVFKAPSSPDQKDPGVKIQLGPSTDNKVPRLYGRNYTGGIIIDAEIKNQNKTMAYAIVISEAGDNDTWTVNKIFRGDAQLNFSGANVTSITDPNATSTTNVANKMRCRVYAGGSSAAHQIFPTSGAVDAYGSGAGQFAGWTSANTMEDLVFAIFEMDYDPENDLVGLNAITFDINNSLNEPSNVLLDYLRNDRYGAGISNTIIDTASFNDWYNYATQNVTYINTSNVSASHDRYQIDGALSTFATISDNISRICQSGGAFFTYNPKQGKFGVVVNRAATAGEKANAFVFNDDNILGSISISSTDLYSLYNQIEVEYASVNQKDQTDTYYAEVGEDIRNTNEPDNKLTYRLEMVNDRSRVSQLANIDLNQSRLSMIVELTADHSSMTVDVGDVVKLTSDLYGFEDKLFRCMRAVETEGADGILTFRFTLLEYDDDVYGDIITQEDLPPPVTGITNWWVLNSNAVLSIGNILVVSDPTQPTANLYSPSTGSVVGTANLDTVRSTFGSQYSSGTFINVPIGVPVNTNYNEATIQVYNDVASSSPPVTFVRKPETGTYFLDDETFNFTIDTYNFNKDTEFHLEIKMRDTGTGAASRTYITAGLNSPRANVITGNDILNDTITADNFLYFAPGAQLQEAGIANVGMASGTTYLNITVPIEYDLSDAENGTYSIEGMGTVVGSLPPVTGSGNIYDVALRLKANVTYTNGVTEQVQDFTSIAARASQYDPTPPPLFFPVVDVIEIAPNPAWGSGYVVDRANVWFQAYSEMGSAISGRGFDALKFQLLKLNKGNRI